VLKFIIGLISLAVLVLALVFGLIWFVDSQGVERVAKSLSAEVGYPVTYDDYEMKTTNGYLDIEGLKVSNPPEQFEVADLALVKQLRVDLDWKDTSGERMVFDEVVLDIENLSVITNDEGVNNVKQLADRVQQAMESGSRGEPAPEEPAPSEEGRQLDYLIRDLKLRIGSVRFKDDSGQIPFIGQQDQIKEVNYTRELQDVTDLESVYHQVLDELSRRGLQEAMPYLKGSFDDLLQDQGVEDETRGQIEEGLRNLFEKRAE